MSRCFFAPGGALTGPQRQRAEKNNIAGQPDLCYDYEKLPLRRIKGPCPFAFCGGTFEILTSRKEH